MSQQGYNARPSSLHISALIIGTATSYGLIYHSLDEPYPVSVLRDSSVLA